MLAEKKLQIDAARHAHLLRVRVDDHARMHLVVARGDKRFLSLDLDHADAAGTDLVEILEIAERRDVDIGRARASRMLVPSGTQTVLPLIVSVTIFRFSLP